MIEYNDYENMSISANFRHPRRILPVRFDRADMNTSGSIC